MNQTRTESLVESSINIASGFVVSFLFWTLVVVPVWQLPITMTQNLEIVGSFTVLAVARSYLWRRFFNAGLHRRVHRLLAHDDSDHPLSEMGCQDTPMLLKKQED